MLHIHLHFVYYPCIYCTVYCSPLLLDWTYAISQPLNLPSKTLEEGLSPAILHNYK